MTTAEHNVGHRTLWLKGAAAARSRTKPVVVIGAKGSLRSVRVRMEIECKRRKKFNGLIELYVHNTYNEAPPHLPPHISLIFRAPPRRTGVGGDRQGARLPEHSLLLWVGID